jgi:hypothetical protein
MWRNPAAAALVGRVGMADVAVDNVVEAMVAPSDEPASAVEPVV